MGQSSADEAAPPRVDHWEQVHSTKSPLEVGWFQECPELSLSMIRACGLPPGAGVIDVGAGASRLIDSLLDMGFTDVSALDLSATALAHSRERLGPRAESVHWYVADVTRFSADRTWDLWHDRAAFHFLTDPDDRKAYRHAVENHVAPGGHLIIATFAEDGPAKCSGLDVVRYGPESLAEALGDEFRLMATERETHRTPSGGEQCYIFTRFLRR